MGPVGNGDLYTTTPFSPRRLCKRVVYTPLFQSVRRPRLHFDNGGCPVQSPVMDPIPSPFGDSWFRARSHVEVSTWRPLAHPTDPLLYCDL